MTIEPIIAGGKRSARRGRPVAIEDREQYVAAARACQLSDYPEGTAEAMELAALVEAILVWEQSNADALH
ncbi:hypothetical protein [Bosea sp. ANAM02]|uniref:hypothetical protein n=1 Tax=Bosea sp. ANAM02 TaxID=2020412 RepID=UPI00140EC541|nr:hypothetical protein [Bosea sp. ANAM02]BCB18105.1 hypothetical protein OCUBac02_09990 [Bosea sp. ANAM02]